MTTEVFTPMDAVTISINSKLTLEKCQLCRVFDSRTWVSTPFLISSPFREQSTEVIKNHTFVDEFKRKYEQMGAFEQEDIVPFKVDLESDAAS